jgi:hypothetical protein
MVEVVSAFGTVASLQALRRGPYALLAYCPHKLLMISLLGRVAAVFAKGSADDVEEISHELRGFGFRCHVVQCGHRG